MRGKSFVAAVALAVSAGTADAGVIVFSGTIDGTEPLSGNLRLFRNAIPSMAPVQKPFPGTLVDIPTFFDTITFDVEPGTVITIDSTVQGTSTFFSIYSTSFNPANLALNYLGDQGASSTANDFSVVAPASGRVVFVVNDVGAVLNQAYSATITFVDPVAVPAPPAVLLAGVGGLCFAAVRRRLSRPVAA
jgi:hypothetical protein